MTLHESDNEKESRIRDRLTDVTEYPNILFIASFMILSAGVIVNHENAIYSGFGLLVGSGLVASITDRSRQ